MTLSYLGSSRHDSFLTKFFKSWTLPQFLVLNVFFSFHHFEWNSSRKHTSQASSTESSEMLLPLLAACLSPSASVTAFSISPLWSQQGGRILKVPTEFSFPHPPCPNISRGLLIGSPKWISQDPEMATGEV